MLPGNEIARALLWSATPIATIATSGNLVETRSNENTISNVVGKILQMIPAALCACLTLQHEIHNRLFFHGMSESKILAGEWSEAFSWCKGIRTPEERTVFADLWEPRITIALGITILALPLICKGLGKVAKHYELHKIAVLMDVVDRTLMTVIKVINVALIAVGIQYALLLPSTPLVMMYSSFLLINGLCHAFNLVQVSREKIEFLWSSHKG